MIITRGGMWQVFYILLYIHSPIENYLYYLPHNAPGGNQISTAIHLKNGALVTYKKKHKFSGY